MQSQQRKFPRSDIINIENLINLNSENTYIHIHICTYILYKYENFQMALPSFGHAFLNMYSKLFYMDCLHM